MKVYSVIYKRTGISNLFSETIRENISASSREMALYRLKKKYGKSIDIVMIRLK